MIEGRSRQPVGGRDRRRYWMGLRGRRRKEIVTLHKPPRDTKVAQYTGSWPPATDDAEPPPPAGSDDNSLNCQSL